MISNDLASDDGLYVFSPSSSLPMPRRASEVDLLAAGRIEAQSDGDSRWYSHPATGRPYLSVTYVTGRATSKPWLMKWAAKLAAEFAVDHAATWQAAMAADGRDAAVSVIKDVAAANRDLKADIGKYVHDVQESLILGTPIPGIPDHLDGRSVVFDADDDEPTVIGQEWLDAFVDGFLNFVTDFGFEAVAAECTVASDIYEAAGTIDAMGRLTKLDSAGEITGLDTKTGAHLGAEILAQIGAYNQFDTVWVKDGTTVPRPRLARWAVLHLRPSYERGYKLLFVEPEKLAQGWEWWQRCRRQVETADQVPAKFGTVIYPPLPDGSQPPPMVEDLKSFAGCSRAVKPLVRAGFRWMSDVAVLERKDVLAIKGVGPKTVDALAAVLAEYRLTFAGEPAGAVA